MPNDKSLLILGVPKSCTSLTYYVCQELTGMSGCEQDKYPGVGAIAGEILNGKFVAAVKHMTIPQYSDRIDDPQYDFYVSFLRSFKRGHVVKDVVNPFVIARFLSERPDDFNAILVKRSPQEVCDLYRKRGIVDQMNRIELPRIEAIKHIYAMLEPLCHAVVRTPGGLVGIDSDLSLELRKMDYNVERIDPMSRKDRAERYRDYINNGVQ